VYTLNGRGEHSWSPDGTHVAIGSPSFDNGTPLWLSVSDGSYGEFFPGNPLTDPGEGFDRIPSWSPDGTRVAYSTVRYAEEVSWVSFIRADGSGVTPFTGAGSYIGGADDPSWSPDGRQIVYSFLGHIWLIGADRSNEHPITAGSEPDWQTLPSPLHPLPPVQSLPVAPKPPSVVAKDPRCQRFPTIIRKATLKMVRAQKASHRAKTRAAKAAALKRLRKLAVQRKGYQTAFRTICR